MVPRSSFIIRCGWLFVLSGIELLYAAIWVFLHANKAEWIILPVVSFSV